MIEKAGPLTSGPTGCASSFWRATLSSAARRHDGLINPHAVLRGLAPCWCSVAVALGNTLRDELTMARLAQATVVTGPSDWCHASTGPLSGLRAGSTAGRHAGPTLA